MADFFLLPNMELPLKGQCCSDTSDMKYGVTERLKGVSLQDFQRASKHLYILPQRSVELWCGYIKVCNENF
jgi:hypothetical protein